MKTFLIVVIGCMSFFSYGQEDSIKSISIAWEQLVTPLSLTKTSATKKTSYALQEVNLSINLREQYLRKNKSTPSMYLPENKFVISKYNVAIPQPKTGNVGFTISGNGYSSNLNSSSGGVKNIAYKDAGLYSGAFCPITGLAY